MSKPRIIVLAFLSIILNLNFVLNAQRVAPPLSSDFAGIQQFLSSDWMEGRETGEKGSFIAADYISSLMHMFKLLPYQKLNKNSYFQDFELVKYKMNPCDLTLIQTSAGKNIKIHFTEGLDYLSPKQPNEIEAELPVVFAGYGISEQKMGFDDYKGIDANGKIVLTLKGFPGIKDTTSDAWRNFRKDYIDEDIALEAKLKAARKHGAVALLIVDDNIQNNKPSNISFLNSTMNSLKNEEPEYDDAEFVLKQDIANQEIPYFVVSKSVCEQIFSNSEFNLKEFEKKLLQTIIPASFQVKDRIISFSLSSKKEFVLVRNVIGMIPGKDTAKYIVVGAHYDHLGKRTGIIYNGADDNASGAAGLLALAKVWSESRFQPPCNIIFGAWTGEEKGLLGSKFFTENTNIDPQNILLYLNMDMISRSAHEDTAKKILSVGTRTIDNPLRDMVNKLNVDLKLHFELDLWDVTGHYGSDYASFRDKNIPVMTFFSGFHDDYHTPRDLSPKVDTKKMTAILSLVNEFLNQFMENINTDKK